MNRQELQPVLDAVRQASQLTRIVQQDFLKEHSKTGEPVTIGDYGAQAIIGRALQMHFPGDGVIAEESGSQFLKVVDEAQRSTIISLVERVLGVSVTEDELIAWINQGHDRDPALRTWIIDPIDGTRGFIDGFGYAIAVGIREDGNRITGGVMGCPRYPFPNERPMLFYAADGAAYAEPLDGGAAVQLQVSDRKSGEPLRIAETLNEPSIDREGLDFVYKRMGVDIENGRTRASGMGKYAMVAAGDVDMYVIIPHEHGRRTNIWDVAAGYAVLAAAGGTLTDKDGNPPDFSESPELESTIFILASNSTIHEPLLGVMKDFPLRL